jgi:hypothetical protein
MTATLQQLLDTFSADVEAYIGQEVARRSGSAVPAAVSAAPATRPDVSAELQELESILSEFKQSSSKKDVNSEVDVLLASLEKFGAKESVLPANDQGDAMEILRSLRMPQEKALDKQESVDFYIEKLSQLNGVSGSATMKSSNKPTGIAYALELLQRYKKATLNI